MGEGIWGQDISIRRDLFLKACRSGRTEGQDNLRCRILLREELHQAGYQNGVCTTVGRAGRDSDPFFLNRLPVNSDDDSQLFRAKLAGSYDWISKPQYLAKMAKSRVVSLGNKVKK